MRIRLNKYLAQLGIVSRRKADDLIAAKQVKVNGTVASLGTQVNSETDTVQVGQKVYDPQQTPQSHLYYKVYKPVGYVSTTSDPEGRPVVTSLVETKERLYPVGRLDEESEGLILLTNDGALTQRLTHPKHHIPKTYQVWVKGNYTPNALNRIRSGLRLKQTRLSPAEVEIKEEWESGALFEITLHQGLNRQIRRMMKAINLEVTRLKRIAVGSVQLGNLKPGEARPLTPQERKGLFQEWYTSPVFHGNKDGTRFSYPTINLDPTVLPRSLKKGVYASWVKVGIETFPAAAYFGPRLIKNETHDVFEVSILDFSAEIYGQQVAVCLEQFIRGVMDFTDFSDLKAQITVDREMVQKALNVSKKSA